jgi:hypothetical protein
MVPHHENVNVATGLEAVIPMAQAFNVSVDYLFIDDAERRPSTRATATSTPAGPSSTNSQTRSRQGATFELEAVAAREHRDVPGEAEWAAGVGRFDPPAGQAAPIVVVARRAQMPTPCAAQASSSRSRYIRPELLGQTPKSPRWRISATRRSTTSAIRAIAH